MALGELRFPKSRKDCKSTASEKKKSRGKLCRLTGFCFWQPKIPSLLRQLLQSSGFVTRKPSRSLMMLSMV